MHVGCFCSSVPLQVQSIVKSTDENGIQPWPWIKVLLPKEYDPDESLSVLQP